MSGGLFQVFIYLLAAVVSVPVAKRLGLGSVLGYLLAGAAIGPSALGWVGADGGTDHVMHVAEFGVVMLLFVIGLELRPARLWELRRPVLGMGGLQVVGTAAAIMLGAMAFGTGWRVGLAAGLTLAMSSTAIVLQSLGEKGLLKTRGGEACFAVLLFQDLAVIPILTVLPLLSPSGQAAPAADEGAAGRWLDTLPAWERAGLVVAAVAAIIAGGRYALRPLFRYIAGTGLREMFTATALGLVVGIALLMQSVGISAALGTFIAGVVLADSEYRHQLEADVEPFKGLLLGLFFISVGAGIDFPFVLHHPGTTLALVAGLLAVKFAVLFGVGRLFGLRPTHDLLFAFALAQGGEFAFVLISVCVHAGVLTEAADNLLTAAVALSMAATPLLLLVNDRLASRHHAREAARTGANGGPVRPPDPVDRRDQGGVIIAGFGRFGSIVGRLLAANGVPTTVLENDPDWVDTMREFGVKTYYGDALREDLLRSAGVEKAKLFVIALVDKEKSLALVDLLRREFPHLQILARARDRIHAYELIRHGLEPAQIYRDTLGTSLDMSADALRAMGMPGAQAARVVEVFRERDREGLGELAKVYDGDRKVFVSTARRHIQNLANLFKADGARDGRAGDSRPAVGRNRRARNQRMRKNRTKSETCLARFAV